jgi:hypothetical protein
MVRCDPPQLFGRRIRTDAAEELTDLPLPAFEVRAEDRLLVGVRNLRGGEMFLAAAEEKVTLACDSKVANPLRVAARRNEIPRPVERQQVDRRAPRLARLSATHFENARTPDAEPESRRSGHDAVEDVSREPVGCDVSLRHLVDLGTSFADTTRCRTPCFVKGPSVRKTHLLIRDEAFRRGEARRSGDEDPAECTGWRSSGP